MIEEDLPSISVRVDQPFAQWCSVRTRAVTLLVAVVAAVARLASWLSTRDYPLTSDAGQYHELARNLAAGLGFSHQFPQVDLHPTAFRPPLYPFLLSLAYRLVGATPGVGRALAVAIGVAVAIATLVAVRRHAGPVAGLAAGLAVALYPPIVANDTLTLTEGLSLLLLVLLLDAVLSGRAGLAGLWCGLLTLARPSAQLLLVLVAAWFLVRIGWRRAATAAAIAALVVAPWIVRNAATVGEAALVSSNGFNLAAMYSRPAQDTGGFVDPVYHPAFDDLRLLQFDEGRWDRALRDRALADLRRHPTRVVAVAGRNALALFELAPRLNDSAEQLDVRNMAVRQWTLPLFYVVTVAGAVGLWRTRSRAVAQLGALVAAYFALGSLLLVAPPRLRAPVDLVLCIGVGLLVSELVPGRGITEPVEAMADRSDRLEGEPSVPVPA